MKHLVIRLEGSALDAAVAFVYSHGFETPFFNISSGESGVYNVYSNGFDFDGLGYASQGERVPFHPSTDWAWAGPLLEQCDTVSFWHGQIGDAEIYFCSLMLNSAEGKERGVKATCYGPTRLVAFCRAYVSLSNRSSIDLP